MSP
ncbi:transporter, AcrB/D/F family domain protein, partial [Vibrio parahaemolyticus V-223/04]|jgi:hypothetical protein